MKTILQAVQIKELLSYRYPFQFIDRVVEYKKNESIISVKAVSMGEQYFSGHFPEFPIMPGVLLIESLAQSASLLLLLSELNWEEGKEIIHEEKDNIGVLGSVKVNLLRPVLAGNLVKLEAKIDWKKASATALNVKAFVDETVCAQGSITVVSTNKNKLI